MGWFNAGPSCNVQPNTTRIYLYAQNDTFETLFRQKKQTKQNKTNNNNDSPIQLQ